MYSFLMGGVPRMILSDDILSLSINEKLIWLKSSDGVAQLQQWLSDGYSLNQISSLLEISKSTFYDICDRFSELAEITGRLHIPVRGKAVRVDLTAPLTYRLMVGLSPKNHYYKILGEYNTAEEVWQDPYIHRHFASYGVSELDYFNNYLSKIYDKGAYTLSNAVCIMYCTVTRYGVVKAQKPLKPQQ
jgi:predicted DNA-binding protein YlxM (UPF0122 family)